MKVRMRERTSFCLTQQHRPYFILCAVNQLEASEQTGKEGAGAGAGDSEKRKQAREKER